MIADLVLLIIPIFQNFMLSTILKCNNLPMFNHQLSEFK